MDIFAGIKESFSDELCKAEFKENSFEVLINNWKGRNFKFACYNLNKDIVPEKSTCKANSTGLVISLKKANDSDYWSSLDKKTSSGVIIINFNFLFFREMMAQWVEWEVCPVWVECQEWEVCPVWEEWVECHPVWKDY